MEITAILNLLTVIVGILIWLSSITVCENKNAEKTLFILIISMIMSFTFFNGFIGSIYYFIFEEIPVFTSNYQIALMAFIGSTAAITVSYMGLRRLIRSREGREES